MTQIVVDEQTKASMLIRYYFSEKKKILWKRPYKNTVSQKMLL